MLSVTIVLFCVFVRVDTPRFYIQNGQTEQAKKVIKKIYNTGDDV